MTEKEYQKKIEELLSVEQGFSLAFSKLSEAFTLINTETPKKLIRNSLAYAVIAIYNTGFELGFNVQDGIDLIQKEFDEKKAKEEENK